MATKRLDQTEGYPQALAIIEANRDPRFDELDRLERFVSTTQYDGLPDWFSTDKPLWERAPCIAYPIVDTAISSNADLLLGEGRFPAITTIPEQTDGDDDFDLEAARKADRLLQAMAEQARLRRVSYEVFAAGQGCGTAVTICGARNGQLYIDTTRAKWCTPEFAADGSVTRLEIQYPYLDRYKVQGQWRVRVLLFRRVIDDQTDTTFLPAEANQSGIEPKNWAPDPARTIRHGLGFCPVVWYAHMQEAAIVNRIDGHAIHEHCLDEIRAHDFAISQRHRAALYCGDPQWIEIGVEDAPRATGRTARPEVLSTPTGGQPSRANPVNGEWVAPVPRKARRKGPGEIWTYPDKDAKVTLVTLPGDALKAIDDHARDLRIKISESLAVVFLDPEGIKFAASLSGKALFTLKARQLDRCDQYRDDFGMGWIVPQVRMLLRVVESKSNGVKLRGLSEARAAIAKLGEWFELHLRWGDYFKRAPDEEAQIVSLVAAAKRDRLVTQKRQLQKLSGVFDIDNVDDEAIALEAEKAEAMERQREEMRAQAESFHAAARMPADDDQARGGPGAGTQPPRGPGSNRGTPPAAAPPGQQRGPAQQRGRRR